MDKEFEKCLSTHLQKMCNSWQQGVWKLVISSDQQLSITYIAVKQVRYLPYKNCSFSQPPSCHSEWTRLEGHQIKDSHFTQLLHFFPTLLLEYILAVLLMMLALLKLYWIRIIFTNLKSTFILNMWHCHICKCISVHIWAPGPLNSKFDNYASSSHSPRSWQGETHRYPLLMLEANRCWQHIALTHTPGLKGIFWVSSFCFA